MTMQCQILLACVAATASAFDLMSAVLKSPIYKNLLVPASRNMMINTAKENGVPWADAVAWIRGATTWELDDDADVVVPAYYRQPFHAYEPGNLCWEAAWEAEVAGRAGGARNYPPSAPTARRRSAAPSTTRWSRPARERPGAGDTILDLGCATGMARGGSRQSSRRQSAGRRRPESLYAGGCVEINLASPGDNSSLSHFAARTRARCIERRGTGIATTSSRRRVDGVEVDATIQHERAVKF